MSNFLNYILNDDPKSQSHERHKFLRFVLGKLNYPFFLRSALVMQSIDTKWKESHFELQYQLSSLEGKQAASENRKSLNLKNINQEINDLKNQITSQNQEINDLKNQITSQSVTILERIEKGFENEGSILSNDKFIILGRRNDLITRYFAENGYWDLHIIKALEEHNLNYGGLALDIGSHIGTISIPLSKIFSEVHSFEASDVNFKYLKANKILNNSENLHIYNQSLYSKELNLSLSKQHNQEVEIPIDFAGDLRPELGSNTGGYTFGENGTGLYSRVSKTIDSYNFQNLSFIKIDAQGCDLEILMGGIETIKREKPLIIFEYESHLVGQHKIHFDDIKAKLISIGYSVDVLKKHNDKQMDYICVCA